MNVKTIITWIFQIIPAVILLQTLRFKFTADPMSVEIFTALGMEPWGRILIGILELIAGILLLTPRAVLGAVLAFGVMVGAIIGHVSILGVTGQHGPLFLMAVATLICSAIVIHLRRTQLPLFGKTME
ncbi:MAG: DoxX family protein [Candidatus Woesearchaeota archaeon]|nr:DoxX family protein [Candidatus Woesearchaeota archaeon]